MNDEHHHLRRQFVDHFVAAFLATYAAQNYDNWCATDEHDRFDILPVEDAFEIAERVWEKAKEFS